MECKKCGSNKLIKYGRDRNGNTRIRCKDCGKQEILFPKKPKKKEVKKTKKTKTVTIEILEEKYLNFLYEKLPDVKWGALVLKTLEKLDPKYANNAGQSFTPDDYKKHLDEVLKNLDE